MALDQSALLEVLEALEAADVGDRVHTAAETIYQALIESELTAVIGAAPHERTDSRTDTRTGLRNGHRLRTLTTAAGGPERRIPKVAGGLVLSVAAGTASPGRSGVVRGGDGGPTCTAFRLARSTTWSAPWARTPGSARARSPGSARTRAEPGADEEHQQEGLGDRR